VKWAAGISILSWALSGTCILAVGFGAGFSGDGKDSPSSITVVGADGQAARLDALLPGNEIGLIVVSEGQKDPEIADNAADSNPPEPAKSTKKSGATKKSTASSKSGAAKKPAAPSASACVNINTADETALTALKGIGPAMAARIIEHRAANGPFRKKEDIQNVKGIGPAKFAVIADAICL
jgi:competence ComEA-like helix-hairpin-helix protein